MIQLLVWVSADLIISIWKQKTRFRQRHRQVSKRLRNRRRDKSIKDLDSRTLCVWWLKWQPTGMWYSPGFHVQNVYDNNQHLVETCV